MSANKNAIIRYRTIDACLHDYNTKWTLENLAVECCKAIFEKEGFDVVVSADDIKEDIQMMRSPKLGYNAPIEMYEGSFYRYSIKEYSIKNMPLSNTDYNVMQEALDTLHMLEEFSDYRDISDMVTYLQDRLSAGCMNNKPVVCFDRMPDVKGLKFFTALYRHITCRNSLRVMYSSSSSNQPLELLVYPYLLKEYRNRWYLYGATISQFVVCNLPLDQIVSVEPVADIPFREHPGFDPEHFFDDVVGVSKNIRTKARLIKFWASREASRSIVSHPLHSSQKLVKSFPDGSSVFTMSVVLNQDLYSLFLSYGSGIKVLSPDSALKFMRDMAVQSSALYADDGLPAFSK